MITFKEELESAMQNLSKAMQPVMEKFRQETAKMMQTPESIVFERRVNALPPNLRELFLCGMTYLESAERFAEHHGDITDWQLFELKDVYTPSPVLAEELKPLRMPEPQPIKQVSKGIPWNKKRDFKRPK